MSPASIRAMVRGRGASRPDRGSAHYSHAGAERKAVAPEFSRRFEAN